MLNDFNVLIVDEDSGQGEMSQLALSIRGIASDYAKNGFQAFKMLKERKYALVLVDIVMQELSGMEFLRCIRREHPKLEVIMFTELEDVYIAVQAMQLGATSYRIKGRPVEQLLGDVMNVKQRFEGNVSKNTRRRKQAEQWSRLHHVGMEEVHIGDEHASLRDVRRQAENAHILAMIEHAGGNHTRAAKMLGISYRQLCNKLKTIAIS